MVQALTKIIQHISLPVTKVSDKHVALLSSRGCKEEQIGGNDKEREKEGATDESQELWALSPSQDNVGAITKVS